MRRAYELYFDGTAKNRHSADQIATLIAIDGTGDPWKLVKQGFNFIFPDGRHEWRDAPDNPNHQYVSALAEGADPTAVAARMEELMLHQPASVQ